MIFQIIYTCALKGHVTTTELEKLAKESRVRNEEFGVTGILIYKDGSILQVLEGEKQVVKRLYQNITDDSRITNILPLIQRLTTQREFPNWSMGYRNADETDFAFDLTANSLCDAFSGSHTPETNTISQTFARINRLA